MTILPAATRVPASTERASVANAPAVTSLLRGLSATGQALATLVKKRWGAIMVQVVVLVALLSLWQIASTTVLVGAALGAIPDGARGFAGADGLGFPTGCTALGEEFQDGGFEFRVLLSGLAATAGVGAEGDDVPVALPLLAPTEGAATGLAGLVGVRGGALGFGFAVGHKGSLW